MIHRRSKKSMIRILVQSKRISVTKIHTKKLRPNLSGFFLIFGILFTSTFAKHIYNIYSLYITNN